MRKSPLFPSILFIATIGLVTTDIYLPSFPAIKKSLFTTNHWVQLTFSLYFLTFSLSQLIYGPLSEKHGRKKIALLGLSISLCGTVICIIAPNIYVLILGRLIQGMGFGIGPTLFRAILRDVYIGDSLAHASSLIAIGTSCLMAAAPTLGGYIETYLGWRFNFTFILLYTGLGIFYMWRFFPETLAELKPSATHPPAVIKQYLLILKNPIFLGYALCGCMVFAGLTIYLSVSPFIFQDILGLCPVQYGWIGVTIAGSLAVGGALNSIFVKRLGRHRLLQTAVSLMVLGALLMLLLSLWFLNVIVILLPLFIHLIGVGAAVGNSNAGALHHFPKVAGFVGALYGTIQILGSSIGTAMMAFLPEFNQVPLSIALLITGFCSFIFQWIGYHFHRKHEQNPRRFDT